MKTLREASMQLVRPAGAVAAGVLAFAAFVSVWLFLLPRANGDGAFRVDEAHKVSETVALRLVLEGRWNDPLWFREIVDRTNPPVGKYFLGAGILASGGELPRIPSLSRLARPLMPAYAGTADSAPYVPLLSAARRASLFATAVTAALLAFLAARSGGIIAAIIAVAWFAGHWMTEQFGATAIFDPLLACLIFTTAALLAVMIARPQRAVALSPLIAIACMLAFQTRLNGGVALGGALLVLGILWMRQRSKNLLIATTLLVAVFTVGTIAINPYYWATAPNEPSIPERLRADQSLVPRVIDRFALQVHELSTILGSVNAGGVRLPLWAAESAERKPIAWTAVARAKFAFVAIGDGPIGWFMLAAALIGLAVALARRDEAAALAMWSIAITVVTLAWLPVPWARYLTPLLPIVALYGGVGCTALLDRLSTRLGAALRTQDSGPRTL